MVWCGESSPLYGAVLKHNDSVNQTNEEQCGIKPNAQSTACAAPCCEKEISPCEKADCCHDAKAQPKEYSKQQRRNAHMTSPAGFVSGLMSDKDSLLLIAVIILLMNENADKKLILALAYVLLF